jgi:hypothetical protein
VEQGELDEDPIIRTNAFFRIPVNLRLITRNPQNAESGEASGRWDPLGLLNPGKNTYSNSNESLCFKWAQCCDDLPIINARAAEVRTKWGLFSARGNPAQVTGRLSRCDLPQSKCLSAVSSMQ